MTTWLIRVMPVAALAACESTTSGGEAQDSCRAALGKLENECAIDFDEEAAESIQCDEQQRCAARCIDSATCNEIDTAFQGYTNAFVECLGVCTDRPLPEPAPPTCGQVEYKLEIECGFEPATTPCNEADTCVNACVLHFLCVEIAASRAGEPNGYGDCVDAC